MGQARLSHKVGLVDSLKWLIYLASIQVAHFRAVLTVRTLLRQNPRSQSLFLHLRDGVKTIGFDV
jgi:hypothetical protein